MPGSGISSQTDVHLAPKRAARTRSNKLELRTAVLGFLLFPFLCHGFAHMATGVTRASRRHGGARVRGGPRAAHHKWTNGDGAGPKGAGREGGRTRGSWCEERGQKRLVLTYLFICLFIYLFWSEARA